MELSKSWAIRHYRYFESLNWSDVLSFFLFHISLKMITASEERNPRGEHNQVILWYRGLQSIYLYFIPVKEKSKKSFLYVCAISFHSLFLLMILKQFVFCYITNFVNQNFASNFKLDQSVLRIVIIEVIFILCINLILRRCTILMVMVVMNFS